MIMRFMGKQTMPDRYGQGFSLIELLVALVISSLVILGVVQIFIANNKSFHMQEANARTQEAGRIALEMLMRESRNAGFLGCTPDDGVDNNLDEDDSGYSDQQHDMNLDKAMMTVLSSSSLSKPADQVTDSHNLRLLGVKAANNGEGMHVVDGMTSSTAELQLNNTDGVEEGNLVAVTDCGKAHVVQVTNVKDGDVIEASGSGSLSPGNRDGNGFEGYSKGAQVNHVGMTTYYVENPTDAEPGLYRWDPEGGSGTELVQGIADMRVQYGVGAGAVDWRSPSAVDPNWSDVRAVRISILVRSSNENLMNDPMTYCFPGEPWEGQDCTDSSNRTTASDGRFYRVYTATASVRNRNLE